MLNPHLSTGIFFLEKQKLEYNISSRKGHSKLKKNPSNKELKVLLRVASMIKVKRISEWKNKVMFYLIFPSSHL